MNPLAHMLTGALIGQVAPSPAAAVVGGLLSHFILDAIPHTEGETFGLKPGSKPRSGPRRRPDLVVAALETVAGIAILGWITGTCGAGRPLSIALGALAALTPDLIDQPLERFRGAMLLHHPALHWTVARRHAFWGILTQVAVAGASGLLLWRASGCG